MKSWVLLGCLVATPVQVHCLGTQAANFLQIGVGPRAVAMGEAHVGLADDVYAAYWNPAGLADLQIREAGFVQNQYVEDIREQFLAYAHPHTALGTFAGSISYLQTGRFQAYDAIGAPAGQVSSQDATFGLSYARRFFQHRRQGSHLAIGLSAKYIQETLDTVVANAYASDVGMLLTLGRRWTRWLEGWRVGIVVRNLGSAMQFDRDRFDLPRRLDLGLAYSGSWREEHYTWVMDMRQHPQGRPVWGTGLELATLKVLLLRAGYSATEDWGNGLRWGAGLRFKVVQVDYAYAHAGDFGAAHRIGLTFRFGRRAEDPQRSAQRWYDQGRILFKEQRYTDALIHFNKALEIDPAHPEALHWMKQSYEEIKALSPD